MALHRVFRYAWGISLLLFASLACNTLTGVGERVEGIQETAQSIGTGVQSGRDMIATGMAVATQVMGNELVQTAQAVATRQAPRLVATAQALATERGPSMLATARAAVEENGPELRKTAEAFATQQGPGLLETSRAMIADLGASMGNPPADIPLVEGERADFSASNQFVSYTTTLSYQSLLEFYAREMPSNGWVEVQTTSVVTANSALLNYEKAERSATVAITALPGNNHTLVVVSIQDQ